MLYIFYRSFNGSSSDNSAKEKYQPDELDDARLYEAGISSGINFNKYSHIPCKVTGENPPHAIETFSDSGECVTVGTCASFKAVQKSDRHRQCMID